MGTLFLILAILLLFYWINYKRSFKLGLKLEKVILAYMQPDKNTNV